MEEKDRKILQILPEAIIIVDNDRCIQFMNSAAIALFEVSDVQEIIGNPFSTLSGGTGPMTYEERVDYINRSSEFALNKVSIPEPDDEQRWIGGPERKLFGYLAIPFHDDSRTQIGFVIRVNDLTNERTAIGYLAALSLDMLPHIFFIRGYADLLLQEESAQSLTEEQREFVTIIKNKCDKLLKLRNDTSEFYSQIKMESEDQI